MATVEADVDTHVLLVDNYDSFTYNLYQVCAAAALGAPMILPALLTLMPH